MSETLKVGDRVRYVLKEASWYTGDDVWFRRSNRDSLIVGLPDEGRYPDYRLVTIFEPGEETSWSDRDFWFAPADRLTPVEPEEPVYEYSVRARGRVKGRAPYPVRDTVKEIERLYGPGLGKGQWVLVRRVKSEWEDVQ